VAERLVWLLQARGIRIELRGSDVFLVDAGQLTGFERLAVALFRDEVRDVLRADARVM
jgi:hypothetical protein